MRKGESGRKVISNEKLEQANAAARGTGRPATSPTTGGPASPNHNNIQHPRATAPATAIVPTDLLKCRGQLQHRGRQLDGAPPCSIGSSPGNNVLPSPARVCCPEPSQQVVQPALSTRMEDLPDDVLLLVMARLGLADIIQCRLVCRRFAPLALHPDVWRRRRLTFSDTSSRWLCAALRLAPFADSMLLTVPTHSCEHMFSAPFAVRSMEVTIQDSLGAENAVQIIKNQSRLGRLREVELNFQQPEQHSDRMSPKDTSDVFEAVASVSGLDNLRIFVIGDYAIPSECRRSYLKLDVTPSLTSFMCSVTPGTEDICNFILARHGATLRKVSLYCERHFALLPETGPLLSRMPHLTELDCPIFVGMRDLAECSSLTTVRLRLLRDLRADVQPLFFSLFIMPSVSHACHSAASFLCNAHQLRTVDLCYLDPDLGVELLAALASSGRSRVEELGIDNDIEDLRNRLPQLRELLRALPLLPALRRLKVNLSKDACFAKELLAKTDPLQIQVVFGYMG